MIVPELPEVESARATIERAALHRTIADVDDTDTWECRPHAPGEIRAALLGRALTAACRQGKSLWCATGADGPVLGLHLGMSGRILVTDGAGALDRGRRSPRPAPGPPPSRPTGNPGWSRFTITFADGGTLRLFDKRRLGRVRLDPDLTTLGPDAERISAAAFRDRVGRGTAAGQGTAPGSVGTGGRRATSSPTRRCGRRGSIPGAGSTRSTTTTSATLHRALRTATRAAVRHGGVHTGTVIAHRRPGGPLPPVRRRDAAGHRRRADDLVLPARTGVTQGAR